MIIEAAYNLLEFDFQSFAENENITKRKMFQIKIQTLVVNKNTL